MFYTKELSLIFLYEEINGVRAKTFSVEESKTSGVHQEKPTAQSNILQLIQDFSSLSTSVSFPLCEFSMSQVLQAHI